MNEVTQTPKEVDTKLAATWTAIYRNDQAQAMNDHSAKQIAGAKFYYRGRQRVTDMTIDEALGILTRIAEENKDESDYAMFGLGIAAGSSLGHVRRNLATRDELETERATLLAERDALEAEYTGWSRFFLVTSSSGHVHSSMNCSTCRPTTTFGWLPELSGSDEATAVDELGPTLCTVCFPSAPVEWTEGKKLSKAAAAKKAA